MVDILKQQCLKDDYIKQHGDRAVFHFRNTDFYNSGQNEFREKCVWVQSGTPNTKNQLCVNRTVKPTSQTGHHKLIFKGICTLFIMWW